MKRKDTTLEDWLSKNTISVLVGVAIGALLFALIIAGLYVFVFRAPPASVDAATMGQVGDFFGGLLNPVFSFLSMLALLVALVIQGKELRMSRKELKLSRKEMRKSGEALESQNAAIEHQRFEQTFFAWMGTYRELLSEVSTGAEHPRTGRNALHEWWSFSDFHSYCGSAVKDMPDPTPEVEQARRNRYSNSRSFITVAPPATYPSMHEAALLAWEALYADENRVYQLDNLFRVLFNLLRWIDSQAPERLSDAQKWMYVGIVRAQLSWIEMAYLFYNGQTTRGEKFKAQAEKYALFNNFTFDIDPVLKILRAYSSDPRCYSESAYDSVLARRAMGLPDSAEETLALAAKGPHQVAKKESTKTGDPAQRDHA